MINQHTSSKSSLDYLVNYIGLDKGLERHRVSLPFVDSL
jgi:hypothetical protein